MRGLLIGLAVAILSAAPQLASAQPYSGYRYCVGSAGNPTSNCGFSTWAQCMSYIQGMGTMHCSENPWYHAAPLAPRRYRVR